MFVRHGHCVKTRPTSRPTALKAVQWTMLACWAILAETWGLVFSPRAIMARLELHGQPGFESQSETQGLNISYSWMFFFLSSSPVISPVSVSAQKPTEHLLIYLLYTHVSCLRGVWPASWQVTSDLSCSANYRRFQQDIPGQAAIPPGRRCVFHSKTDRGDKNLHAASCST